MEWDIRRVAITNRYLKILRNERPEEWRRDWWRVRLSDAQIWLYILFLEPSSLGALSLYRRQRGGRGGGRHGGERVRSQSRGPGGLDEPASAGQVTGDSKSTHRLAA